MMRLSRRRFLQRAATTAAVAVGTAMGASGLPSVAFAAPTRQAKTIVRYWDFQQSDKSILEAQAAAVQQFQEANPDIEIQVEVTPYIQYRDKLLTATRGGTPPDIAQLDQIWVSEFAAADAIIPLDDYIAKSSVIKPEIFFPGAWASNVYKGSVWGIPNNNDVWQELYYNRTLFEQAGLDPDKPPTTWEELSEMGAKLTRAPDVYGLALYGVKNEVISVVIDSWIYSNGGKIVSDDGKSAAIDSPEAIEAIKHYVSLQPIAPPGTPTRNEEDAVGLFVAGKVAMGLFGSWQQDSFKNRAPDMQWDLAMTPAPAGKQFHGTLGGWNSAIFKGSKSVEAAWKYIEFLADKEIQKKVNSLIPARLDAGKEFIEELRKRPDVIFTTVNTGLPRPISPVYPQISDAQQQMMQDIWAGTPVEEAVKACAKNINDILATLPA